LALNPTEAKEINEAKKTHYTNMNTIHKLLKTMKAKQDIWKCSSNKVIETFFLKNGALQ